MVKEELFVQLVCEKKLNYCANGSKIESKLNLVAFGQSWQEIVLAQLEFGLDWAVCNLQKENLIAQLVKWNFKIELDDCKWAFWI